MLKVGDRAIIRVTCATKERFIAVRAGSDGYNVLQYGNDALCNDFNNTVLLVAALEDATTHDAVLTACTKYARYAKCTLTRA